MLFFVYLAGVVSAIDKGYFYWKVQESILYAEALKDWEALRQDNLMVAFPARNQESGVTIRKGGKMMDGLTLYSDNSPSAYLLDPKGRLVHQWHLPYEAAFGGHKDDLQYIYWHGLRLMPNGDLFGIYEDPNHTPYGAGLVKIDKDSHLLWAYGAAAHHGLDVAPDGRVFVILQTIEEKPLEGLPQLHPPFMHDYIAVLNANGEELKRVSLLGALQHSAYAHLIDKLPAKQGDLTHLNSVQYITAGLAKVFPQAQEGEVLISIPKLGAIALLDPEKEVITWLKTGGWAVQHDAQVLNNGHILLFDNWGKAGVKTSGSSRVLEYDPALDATVWSYEGTKEHPLFSESQGAVQALANGNMLITESDMGRLVEVTRKGEAVWEYYSPARLGKNRELIGIVNSGTRYTLPELPFLVEP